MLMNLLVGRDHKWFFLNPLFFILFCIFQLSIMSMCYCKKKNETIRQYKWQFWKIELKSPSLWNDKMSKELSGNRLAQGKTLDFCPSAHSPFYLPATQTTCSSLNTCPLTPPGLYTCCSSALHGLPWTAYLQKFFSSFKISKHPNTPLLLLLADGSTPSIRQFICIPTAAIILSSFTLFPLPH